MEPSRSDVDSKAREWITEAWYDEEHDPDCLPCAIAQIRDLVKEHHDNPVFMRAVQLMIDDPTL